VRVGRGEGATCRPSRTRTSRWSPCGGRP
jgi:hypothetical protein